MRTVLFLAMAVSVFAHGCSDVGAGPQLDSGKSAPTGTDAGPPLVEVAEIVAGGGSDDPGAPTMMGDLPDRIDLPGATVRGFETARLFAKMGGYIDAISDGPDGQPVDIGTRVSKGNALAVISAPEWEDDRSRQQALVLQREAEVQQAQAAVTQSKAERSRQKAESESAEAAVDEKKAFLQYRTKQHERISRLAATGTVSEDAELEAEFHWRAAEASVTSAIKAHAAALSDLTAADANILKAEHDVTVADQRLKVANAELDRLNTLLSYSRIVAPFDGIVTRRYIERGDFVQAATSNANATPLFEVAHIERVRVIAKVPMKRAPHIATGLDVIFHSIGGLPGESFPGVIARSSIALDPETRMMRVEVDLPNDELDYRLRPGMYGTITVKKDWERVVRLDTACVATTDDRLFPDDPPGQPYVMVVDALGDSIRKSHVEVIRNDGIHVFVTGDLDVGERIVTSGLGDLAEGPVTLNSAKSSKSTVEGPGD